VACYKDLWPSRCHSCLMLLALCMWSTAVALAIAGYHGRPPQSPVLTMQTETSEIFFWCVLCQNIARWKTSRLGPFFHPTNGRSATNGREVREPTDVLSKHLSKIQQIVICSDNRVLSPSETGKVAPRQKCSQNSCQTLDGHVRADICMGHC
jgi:hypothetical protein